MNTVKESEGDQAGPYYPSSDDVVQGSSSSCTVKVSEGDQAGPYYPSNNLIQGSGSSYCPSRKEIGTLGVRVDTAPNTGFCYVAIYHNSDEDKTDYAWIYNSNGKTVLG